MSLILLIVGCVMLGAMIGALAMSLAVMAKDASPPEAEVPPALGGHISS